MDAYLIFPKYFNICLLYRLLHFPVISSWICPLLALKRISFPCAVFIGCHGSTMYVFPIDFKVPQWSYSLLITTTTRGKHGLFSLTLIILLYSRQFQIHRNPKWRINVTWLLAQECSYYLPWIWECQEQRDVHCVHNIHACVDLGIHFSVKKIVYRENGKFCFWKENISAFLLSYVNFNSVLYLKDNTLPILGKVTVCT